MTDSLAAIAEALVARRPAILTRWRETADADPELTTVSALSRAQFYDHIPEVLDAFDRRLRARRPHERAEAARDERDGAMGHGLVRWQQGYRQRELMREWRHLHLILVDELETIARANPQLEPDACERARRELATLAADGVCESATQYSTLQQVEASGRLTDLEAALAALTRLQSERAEILREAAHDLRGSLGVVRNAAVALKIDPASPAVHADKIELLERGIASMQALLNDLISLARLEAGHEQRQIGACDAAALLRELCATLQPLARSRGLALLADGPAELCVQADATKLRRIAQNLLLNALKYTGRGGVVLNWQEVPGATPRWVLSVQDTGPGLDARDGAPLAHALKTATDEALAVGERAKAGSESAAAAEPPALLSSLSAPSAAEPPGEGIGLAIVKRLCELLDATVELHTEPGKGSTFRIFFPCRY
ncbi:MAG TPA: sensor histidine kinase [Burkholderiales bacterium]|nr:sensor histidine kinase [Burkholderiales bacterium]